MLNLYRSFETTRQTKLRTSLLALAAGLLVLTGCSSSSNGNGESESTGSGASTGESSGTVTFDGEELVLSNITCNRVPVEDNAWRILGNFDGGEVQLDEGSGRIVIRFDDEDHFWSNSGGDNEIPLDVGEHGSTGETVVHWSGGDAPVVVDISCCISS